MNSNYGKSDNPKNFDFDLGLGSNRSRSLKDQKHQNPSTYSYASSSSYSSAQPRSAWQPNKPSWTHQPASSLVDGPSSMVGDINGKSWGSAAPSTGIGIVNKINPNLFGDLVTSALGQGSNKAHANSSVPLKHSTPTSSKGGSFSMGNVADTLPKGGTTASAGNWATSSSSANMAGSFPSFASTNNNARTTNLGGSSMRSMAGGSGPGSKTSSKKDPFGSLVDFSSRQSATLNSASKAGQNSYSNVNNSTGTADVSFGDFQSVSNTKPNSNASAGSKSAAFDMGDFGEFEAKPAMKDENPLQASGGDPFGMFFSSSSASVGSASAATEVFGGQKSSEIDDWGLDPGFGGDAGHDGGDATMELERLPPPPAGITASAAKSRGLDNYKKGQFPDAIKWLSWAIILFEKIGDTAGSADVLSSRASCYKEVGEYKKAVADCTKVLEHDDSNVSVLVQRALLYESMEKYRLGAEDLRTVLKIDSGNRIARSTIHRLTKLAD